MTHDYTHAQVADQRMREMSSRLDAQESKQQTIIHFFAAAIKNPAILQHILSSVNANTAAYNSTEARGLTQWLGPPASREGET